MVKRIIRMLSITIGLLMMAAPAWAKVIPTDTEVAVDGNSAVITVDAESHGGPGDVSEVLETMIGLYPVDALDESGRPPVGTLSTPMEFQQVDADTYRAVVEVPGAGEWAVVPFPFDPNMTSDLYPTVRFTADPNPTAELIVAESGWSVIPIIGLVVAALVVAAVMIRVVTRLRSAKAAPAPGPGPA